MDSFEEQVAEDLDVPAEYAEDAPKPDRCSTCGQFAQIAETRVRKRGTVVVEVFDCGHRRTQ